jgi:hypothetical protein
MDVDQSSALGSAHLQHSSAHLKHLMAATSTEDPIRPRVSSTGFQGSDLQPRNNQRFLSSSSSDVSPSLFCDIAISGASPEERHSRVGELDAGGSNS